MPKNKNKGQSRNYKLESGVVRFGPSKTYHKKAVYKFLKKKTAKKSTPVKPAFVEKKIGGDKNGGTRMVRTRKFLNNYDTEDKPAPGTSKKFFAKHVRRVRPSLSAGTVAIVLAGAHKGKRVVVLKTLSTGLLLITGPFKVNGCPLRRINQRYLIATSTKVSISSVKLPEKLNDDYFRHAKAAKKQAKKEGDIFEAKKEEYKASDERKKDQLDVDKQVLEAIKKHPEGALLKNYLRHNFALSKGQYAHKMTF
jgi:large subunit ribosomal protein L6e